MRARLLFGWCTAGFLAVTLSLGPGAGVQAAAPTADLVLLGGKIITMDRERAARTPPGTWIVVAGGWHESQFTERRKPTPQEIDAISADHPIWVQYLYDEAMMNRAAMTAVGLTAETKDPFGGKVLKDAS